MKVRRTQSSRTAIIKTEADVRKIAHEEKTSQPSTVSTRADPASAQQHGEAAGGAVGAAAGEAGGAAAPAPGGPNSN